MEIYYIVLSYLIGSIPVAWIITKVLTGNDIRAVGSGNVGVMNVAISVSRWAGLLVFSAEAAKGVGVVLVGKYLQFNDLILGLGVVAAVAGTRWSIWLRGAGGRGNTTGISGILLLAWQAVVLSLVVWVLGRLLTHRSFWATRIWISSLPAILILATQSWSLVLWGCALSLIYLVTHKEDSDDHGIIKEQWPNLWRFIITPPRRKSQ
jgi:acyl phosphate:glycerol-3-phosphate acyltransferase